MAFDIVFLQLSLFSRKKIRDAGIQILRTFSKTELTLEKLSEENKTKNKTSEAEEANTFITLLITFAKQKGGI